KRYKAGDSLEDYCRACKTDRMHTVIAADGDGRPIRVACGFCRSDHNYRGGPRVDVAGPAAVEEASSTPMRAATRARSGREPFPLVSDRERIAPPMTIDRSAGIDLELLLRRVIREEAGISAVAPAEKWRGGSLVLRPGAPGVQEKSWP